MITPEESPLILASKKVLPTLAPDYYLDNFQLLMDSVRRLYGDLLTSEELEFSHGFFAMSGDARRLYVRLLSRRGPAFRELELAYAEITDIPAAVTELEIAGFVSGVDCVDLSELSRLYRKAEIASIFADTVALRPGESKRAMLAVIGEMGLSEDQLFNVCQSWRPERVVVPAHQDTMVVIKLLFFGNQHQSLTDFVLSDLGVNRFYPYLLDHEQRLFESRAMIDEYLSLVLLRLRYSEWLEVGSNEDELLELAVELVTSRDGSRFSGRWYRFNNRVARQLERCSRLEAALNIYAFTPQHPARERAARICYGQEKYEGAAAICDLIEKKPFSEEELEFSQRFRPRIQRKLKLVPIAPAADVFQEVRLVLSKNGRGVEARIAEYYADRGDATFFVENGLMNGLFGLAFWREIFAGLPGVFVNAYQFVPLDMYSPNFFRRREELLERRMAELRSNAVVSLLADYDEFEGYANGWVNWQLLTRSLVETALARIPVEHLEAIWRRILFDPRANRSGFPDLIQFPSAGGYRMVEVKGPGDSLQNNQKRWLRFFQRHQIPSLVAFVRWQDEI
ncbi:MAG: hypothetical protein ACI9GW_000625 [Halieaceae bacterium]